MKSLTITGLTVAVPGRLCEKYTVMKIKKWLPVLEGFSGKLGNKVFYTRNGKTFIRKAPGSYNKTPTPVQAVTWTRFQEAIAYAQGIISDPVLKAVYQQKAKQGRSAYNAAITEYLGR